ncbi:MAG: hypothetical protein M1385_00615 [Candidatus Marsarchaeota archaeon]|nr:hypothetical protein [Candidatus Marsarchaeota archaeon]
MLFGKKDAPETLKIYDLDNLLDRFLAERLKELDSNSTKIKRDATEYINKFKEHCDYFETEDFEPNTDNLYMPNIKAIKSQKFAYSRALKNILDMQISESGQNLYEKHLNTLESISILKTKILELNASYKQMLFSYAAYTKGFKKNLIGIDNCIRMLNTELSKNKYHYDKYNAIKSLIVKIHGLEDNYNEINMIINSNNNGNAILLNKNSSLENELIEKINSDTINTNKLKIASVEMKKTFLSNFQYIEKLSRKFDYIYHNKPGLNYYISDPIKNVDNDSYNDFIRLILLLKEAILSKKIEVRNVDDIIMQIDALIKLDILKTINEINTISLNESTLLNKLNSNIMELDMIKSMERKIELEKDNRIKLQQSFDEINKRMAETAFAIENAFLEIYKKNIKIIIH